MIVAIAGWLAYPVLPTFDSLSALVWGREILHGSAPGFADFGAPTQHPLWVGVGTVLAPFGDAGARAMTVLAVASFVVLVVATYLLGRTAFGRLAGALAAGLLLTRLDFGFYAAFAFVDVPFAALVVSAAALEAARPRRGAAVWALLVLAGLLRPEGWLFAAAYGAWVWRSTTVPGRWRIVAWVALAPLVWALTDLAATGDPLFSWTYTTGQAGRLGRQLAWYDAPHALWSALAELLKGPIVLVGVVGAAVAVAGRDRRQARVPLALVVLGATTFTILVLGGGSGEVPRYASIAAVGLVLFAGYLIARLLRPRAGTGPRLALAATVLLLAGGAVWTAAHLHPRSVTGLLSFRHDVERDLAGVLRRPDVRAARRCGPIAVPTFKLVPNVRWQLDAPASAAVARDDPAAPKLGRPGVVLIERTRRLIHDSGYGPFGQNADGNSPPSVQLPPAGYASREHTRYFAIYTRC